MKTRDDKFGKSRLMRNRNFAISFGLHFTVVTIPQHAVVELAQKNCYAVLLYNNKYPIQQLFSFSMCILWSELLGNCQEDNDVK